MVIQMVVQMVLQVVIQMVFTNDTSVGINDTNDTSDTDDTNDTNGINVGINGGTNTLFVLASALCIVFIAKK